MSRMLVIIAPFAALIAVLIVLGWGLGETSASEYTITGIGFDEGLVIHGVLTLDNPSRLPVPIRSITYAVSTDGGVIATGSLDGFLLAPGESSTNMTVVLTSETALAALRTSEGTIRVDGAANLLIIGPVAFSDAYEIPPLVLLALLNLRSIIGESA